MRKIMRKTFTLSVVFCFSLFLMGMGKEKISFSSDPYESFGIAKPQRIKDAPKFTLKDLNGTNVSLSKFKGKPVLLNFWATWCGACKEELPSMERLHKTAKEHGIQVVAISIDRGNQEKVQKYVKEYNLTFPILLDPDQKVRRSYFILGLPTSYLIDSQGKLRGFISGARQWDNDKFYEVLSTIETQAKALP